MLICHLEGLVLILGGGGGGAGGEEHHKWTSGKYRILTLLGTWKRMGWWWDGTGAN